MKKFGLIVVLFMLFSCQKEKTNPYLGNWTFDAIVDSTLVKSRSDQDYLLYTHSNFYNFEILNDSIIDFKIGFYANILDYTSYYLGRQTAYKIKDSQLLYYDKYDNEWDSIQIMKFSKDTLFMVGPRSLFFRLIKTKKKPVAINTTFDAIVVDRGICGGKCPYNSTYVDRNGNFYFKGYKYNTQDNHSYSKLNKEITSQVFAEFENIDINKLKDNYFYGATDSQTNTISFLKNGKIIKTIESYIECPLELEIAMTRLSYVYQQVKPFYFYDDGFIFHNKVNFSFGSKDLKYRMMASEAFYLENEIRKGTKTNFNFSEKYELQFNHYYEDDNYHDWTNDKIVKITTDGRYYKFVKADKSEFTIDIGYDFIEKNPIIKKDRRPT